MPWSSSRSGQSQCHQPPPIQLTIIEPHIDYWSLLNSYQHRLTALLNKNTVYWCCTTYRPISSRPILSRYPYPHPVRSIPSPELRAHPPMHTIHIFAQTQLFLQQCRSQQRNNSRSPIPSRVAPKTPGHTSLRSVRQIIQSYRELAAADLARVAVAGIDAVCAIVQSFGEGGDVLAAVAFAACADCISNKHVC